MWSPELPGIPLFYFQFVGSTICTSNMVDTGRKRFEMLFYLQQSTQIVQAPIATVYIQWQFKKVETGVAISPIGTY